MKKIFLPIAVLLFLFVGFNNNVLAQVTVAGAGSAFVDGIYSITQTYQGKNFYQGGTSNAYLMYWESGYSPAAWKIAYGNGQGIYLNTANTTLPPAGGWQQDNVYSAGGALPAPTLSGDVDPMPVELTSFAATANGKNVELVWNTATEVNNHGFEVEKNVNGTWNKIGFVAGAGNSNSPKSYNYVDARLNDVVGQVSASGTVSYRLKQIDNDGKFVYSNVVEAIVTSAPAEFGLSQNYPNPFNPSTLISYQLPMNTFVTVKVYDVLGNEVATLVNSMQEAGSKIVQFNASNLSSGMYFYTIKAGNFTATKKLLLMK